MTDQQMPQPNNWLETLRAFLLPASLKEKEHTGQASIITTPKRLVLGTQASSPHEPVNLQGTSFAMHELITGITGSGKSLFIAGNAVQTFSNRLASIAIIDPHGDLVRAVLAILFRIGYFNHPHAFEKLLYLDFSRDDAFVPFNVLSQPPFPPHLIAASIVEAFRRVWPNLATGSAPNLEQLLSAASVVLAEQNQPLTALQRFFTDPAYRDSLVNKTSDTMIRYLFLKQFDLSKQADMQSASTMRRIFLLSFTPALRFSLRQTKNILNFLAILDNNVSCLFNLNNLDPQAQRLLGCLLTLNFESAALIRSNISEEERSPMHLFIDEFGQFCSQSEDALERILTLTRKFGLSLCLSTQTIASLKHLYPALQNALHISFRMGDIDAPFLAPKFSTTDLASLKRAGADRFLSPDVREKEVISDAQAKLAWSKLLQELAPREALVKLGHETIKFQTIKTPPHPELRSKIEEIENTYARLLLTPRHQIQDVWSTDSDTTEYEAPRILRFPTKPQVMKEADQPNPLNAPQEMEEEESFPLEDRQSGTQRRGYVVDDDDESPL